MTDTDNSTATSDQDRRDISWRRIANIVGLALLIAIVVPFVVFAVPQVVGADQSYVVLSGSMEPAMSPGDVIIVNSVPASAIERNDVITFGGQGGDTPTTHRVIEVVEQDGTTAFRTQGDANDNPDGALVTPNQLQGKVLSPAGYLLVIPFIGYLINFAGTQSGIVLFIALPVSLLVLNEIWNVIVSARSTPGTDGNVDAEPEVDTGGAETAEAVEGDPSNASETENPEMTAQHDTAAAASDSVDAGISFTAAELQLGLGVNAAFLAYSIWVVYGIWTAYDTVETWALGVVGAVGASFLLLGGLYVFGGSDATDEAASGEPASDSGTESDPDQALLASPDEATADHNGTHPENTPVFPEVNSDSSEMDADAFRDSATNRTNGDGQPAPSRSDGGDPAIDTNTTGGEADE